MPYVKLGASVLVGGVSYVLILILLAHFGYASQFDFMASGFVALAFGGLGAYLSVDSKNREKKFVIISIALIVLCHYILHIIIHRDFSAAFNSNFILTGLTVSIFGYAVGVGKIQNIEAKENPKTISPVQAYELAKNYRMNPVIRLCGTVMGLIFVFCPIWFLFNLPGDSSALGLSELVMVGVLLIGTPLMGVMFLAYSIPGKTPNFMLRQMEKK